MKVDAATCTTTIPTRRSSITRSASTSSAKRGGRERVAIEISRELALELIEKIKAAIASGDAAHATPRALSVAGPAEVASLF